MAALLEEIIAARKAKDIGYEEDLKRIADLVKQVEAGHEDDIVEVLKKSPALRALCNNLKKRGKRFEDQIEENGDYIVPSDPALDLALRLDETIKRVRPDDWRGVEPRERMIKKAMYEVLNDVDEVERIFIIIKAQKEY